MSRKLATAEEFLAELHPELKRELGFEGRFPKYLQMLATEVVAASALIGVLLTYKPFPPTANLIGVGAILGQAMHGIFEGIDWILKR